jgi:cysteinyl-tRNA synthetase
MLTIYNSYSRQKELFKPLKPGKIGLYVCGMTVYNYCHIGHGRVLVIFDVITRYLRMRGFDVHYVRNITDVDDKIIQKSKEKEIKFTELTDYFINALHEDERNLGIMPPDQEPRATEHMPHMISMIESLLQKNYAYIASNGDVYYKVSLFKNYGRLAHKDLEGLRAGARVEVNDSKIDPLDFALWKIAKPGEPSWPSPWGQGRPGWHIECAAMSTHCLGNHFDIHGGGFDLQFPHHENEIAQAEAATDETFVNTWMHVGFVQVNKEKMSKSLGNFTTLRDVLAQYPAEVIRYFMLTSHYRSPISYSQESLQNAEAALVRLYNSLRGLPQTTTQLEQEFIQRFNATMDDDFNTSEACAVLFDLAREINRVHESDLQRATILGNTLRYLGGILGILQEDSEQFLHGKIAKTESQDIEKLIAARNEARQEKQWEKADQIRQQLEMIGVILEDDSQGTQWRRK